MSTIVAQTIIAKSRLPIDSRTFAIGGQMFPSTRQTALSLVPRMRRLSYNSAANESTSLCNLWCCLAFAPIPRKRSCASRDQAKINVFCLVLVVAMSASDKSKAGLSPTKTCGDGSPAGMARSQVFNLGGCQQRPRYKEQSNQRVLPRDNVIGRRTYDASDANNFV